MKKEIIKNFPSLSESQILTDEMMDGIESGACKQSCKKSCITNMNQNGDVERNVDISLGSSNGQKSTVTKDENNK